MLLSVQQLRKLSSYPTKPVSASFSAKLDVISLRRAELVQELCKAHKVSHHYDNQSAGPCAETWASKFIASAHLLESFMLLRHHKEAKSLMYKFRSIDPDRGERYTTEDSEVMDKHGNQHQNLDELSFLTHFAYILKSAGYQEVPQDIVKRCLTEYHKYENIELQVQQKNYTFVRFWVNGRKEVNEEKSESTWKPMFSDEVTKRVLYERVIVASRSKLSSNMILKGFKDIPINHFEVLLPEARVRIPRMRKFILNSFLTITGIIAFFNIGMVVLTDFHLQYYWTLMAFSGFLAYRISSVYRSQRNKYILAWKGMLYYKSTANNSGLVLDTINRAHEQSLKEAILLYGTALNISNNEKLVNEKEVTEAACEFLTTINKDGEEKDIKDVDFSSSFSFLQRLGLLVLTSPGEQSKGSEFYVLEADEASDCLSQRVLEMAGE